MPAEIFDEIVRDVISQETIPSTARTDFKWTTCTGAICAEHMEYLATAKLRFAKHTDDAQVTLEQFNLLDPPSSTTSQPSSNSSLPKESFHAAEHGASMSNDGGRQKGKKRQAPGDGEFAASNEAKKVALMQQVRSDVYS
jgi:hypothetical protein